MMHKNILKIATLLILSVVLASCSILGGGNAQPLQPVDVEATLSAIKTVSFATVAAQFTQTAASLPTDTPYPTPEPVTATPLPATATPIPSSTPFPTFVMPTQPPPIVPNTATITVTATSTAYSCQVLSQSPWIGKGMPPSNDFDMRWVVKNNGTNEWSQNSFDYAYKSGTKFQKYADGADFTKSVKSGEQIELVVDMIAPAEYGVYSAVWQILRDGNPVCSMDVQIWVK